MQASFAITEDICWILLEPDFHLVDNEVVLSLEDAEEEGPGGSLLSLRIIVKDLHAVFVFLESCYVSLERYLEHIVKNREHIADILVFGHGGDQGDEGLRRLTVAVLGQNLRIRFTQIRT